MQDLMFWFGGITVGLSAGLGWGWVSSRVFTRPLAQDVSAILLATAFGCASGVSAEIARLATRDGGGLGAVSGGISEFALLVLPAMTVVLATASYLLRRRIVGGTALPVGLGGIGALIGLLWVASTMTFS